MFQVLFDKSMKYFILLVKISVGCSLKCYHNRKFYNVHPPKVDVCNPRYYNNGTSCATIKLINQHGELVTIIGCYFKMKEPKGVLEYLKNEDIIPGWTVRTYPANYTTCEEDLCNASESFRKTFSVLTITDVLVIFNNFF